MKKTNNSHDLRHQVNLYFDNALNDNEKSELLQKVDLDPKCNKIFNKEKNFRNFIKDNVKRPSVSSDLIDSIRNQIRII